MSVNSLVCNVLVCNVRLQKQCHNGIFFFISGFILVFQIMYT